MPCTAVVPAPSARRATARWGLLPITLFGVFVLVTALPLLRVMKETSAAP